MTSDVTVDGPPFAPDASELDSSDVYRRAANYLSVGQIYLLDHPLLREPLRVGATASLADDRAADAEG